MNKYILLFAPLLLLTFLHSCKGQKKTEQPTETTVKSKPLNSLLPPADPYFTGAPVITSAYGPSSITRNILQDKKGNHWFATWEGIVQYDGTTFTNYTNKEGLRRHRVFTILEANDGDIWFGTIGAGLYRYDGKSFINYTTEDGLVFDEIGCITQDSHGDIWIGTMGGISKYDGKSFTNYTKRDGLCDGDVNSIIEDKTGKLWIGTRGKACYYDGKTFTKVSNTDGSPFMNVRTVIEDTDGNIWLGGNDGLWRYDGSTFTNYTENFVGYIFQDKQKNIWTSSADNANGNSQSWLLSKYDSNAQKNKEVSPEEIKAIEGMIFGITEDREGSIWFGTLDGAYRYDLTSFDNFKE